MPYACILVAAKLRWKVRSSVVVPRNNVTNMLNKDISKRLSQ